MLHPYIYAGMDNKRRRVYITRLHAKKTPINLIFHDYCYSFFCQTLDEAKKRTNAAVAARTMIDLYYLSQRVPIIQIAKQIQKCDHSSIIHRLHAINNRMKEPLIIEFFNNHPQLKKTLNEYIYGK